MNLLKFPLVMLALIVAGGAQAQYVASHECHYCYEADYEQRARVGGVGEHQVYDFGYGQYRRYQVGCGTEPIVPQHLVKEKGKPSGAVPSSGCWGNQLYVTTLESDPVLTAAIVVLGEHWRANGGVILKARYDFPAEDIGAPGMGDIERDSVHEYLGYGQNLWDSRIADWLTGGGLREAMTYNAGASVASAIGAAISAHIIAVTDAITVRIVFRDGSYREFECADADRCKAIERSNRDSDGNSVPEQDEIREGSVIVAETGPNSQSLETLLAQYQIPIRDCRAGECTSGTGGSTQLECRTEGVALVCRRQAF